MPLRLGDLEKKVTLREVLEVVERHLADIEDEVYGCDDDQGEIAEVFRYAAEEIVKEMAW